MKYTYAYKTSDGARHEAAMEAESREAVFAALRARGITAIKVVAADGSKANGEVRPAKTAMIIGWSTTVASLLVLSFALSAFFAAKKASEAAIISTPRHQIYGDPAIMEGLERGDFAAAQRAHGAGDADLRAHPPRARKRVLTRDLGIEERSPPPHWPAHNRQSQGAGVGVRRRANLAGFLTKLKGKW